MKLRGMIEKSLLRDLMKVYPDIDYLDPSDLISSLMDIFGETSDSFIFIIDEWDCIFRENREDAKGQKIYLDFIRNLLKDQS